MKSSVFNRLEWAAGALAGCMLAGACGSSSAPDDVGRTSTEATDAKDVASETNTDDATNSTATDDATNNSTATDDATNNSTATDDATNSTATDDATSGTDTDDALEPTGDGTDPPPAAEAERATDTPDPEPSPEPAASDEIASESPAPPEAVDDMLPEGTSSSSLGPVYLLDVPAENWAYPSTLGPDMGPFVPGVLIAIDAQTNIVLGTAKPADAPAEQDRCAPTTSAPQSLVDRRSQIGPVDFPTYIRHTTEDLEVRATAYDFTLTNVLPLEASNTELQLVVTMDMRDLYPLFTQLADETDAALVCNALSSGGAPCEPCPIDAQPYCLTLEAVSLSLTPFADTLEVLDETQTDGSCTPALD